MFDGLWDGHQAADGVSAVIRAGTRAAQSWGGQAGHGGGSASHTEGVGGQKPKLQTKMTNLWWLSHKYECKLTLGLRHEDFVFSEQHSERSLQQQRINIHNAVVNHISLIT